jgi:adenine deaminase
MTKEPASGAMTDRHDVIVVGTDREMHLVRARELLRNLKAGVAAADD